MTPKIFVPAVRRSMLALPLVVAAGCANHDIAEPAMNGPYQLSVINTGTLELRDIMILTSARDTVRIAAVSAGSDASFDGISAVHNDPWIRATVSGRVLELAPVEGFTGFNPRLPVGGYVMTLRSEPDGRALNVQLRAR